jgi:fucose permease
MADHKIIDISEYRSRKDSMLQRLINGHLVVQHTTAATIATFLRNNCGLRAANAYHYKNSYVVVLNIGLIEYSALKLKWLFKGFDLERYVAFLARVDPDLCGVKIYRSNPSERQISKHMQKIDKLTS